MTTTATAYHGDPKLRARYMRGLAWHAKQDAIIQGTYGDDLPKGWRGCDGSATTATAQSSIVGPASTDAEHNAWVDGGSDAWADATRAVVEAFPEAFATEPVGEQGGGEDGNG